MFGDTGAKDVCVKVGFLRDLRFRGGGGTSMNAIAFVGSGGLSRVYVQDKGFLGGSSLVKRDQRAFCYCFV